MSDVFSGNEKSVQQKNVGTDSNAFTVAWPMGIQNGEPTLHPLSRRFPLFRILYPPCVQSIGKEERKSINGGLSNTIKNKDFGLG